jgi:TRAP-type C4-dicarboxylate transport system permease small subunit
MMAVLVFFALAWTARLDRNVKMELVMQHFSRQTQPWLAMVTGTISCFLCLLIASAMFVYAYAMRASGEVSMDLWIPKYPFVCIMASGCVVLALVHLMKALEAFREARSLWNP